MTKFLVLLHEPPPGESPISPEEIQAVIAKYVAWHQQLVDAGHMELGYKLTEEGGKRLLHQDGQVVVSDGPYSEAKEVIGGLFVIEAEDYEQAVALCRDCPHLDHGRIELRQVEPT